MAAIIFLVPETYHPVLLRRKAIKLRKDTGNPAWRAPIENMNKSVFRTVAWSCVRPFQLLFLEAMCLSLCILSAILLGILYLFFGVSKARSQNQQPLGLFGCHVFYSRMRNGLTRISPLGVPTRLREQPRLCFMADRTYFYRYLCRYGYWRLL